MEWWCNSPVQRRQRRITLSSLDAQLASVAAHQANATTIVGNQRIEKEKNVISF